MVGFLPVPNQSQVMTALRSFLLSVMPQGMYIIQGQANRVAEPNTLDFIVFTPTAQRRIETNVDTYADAAFTASIAGNVMTVTSVQFGTITVGAQLFGVNLAAGTTTVVGFISGTSGGVGTYSVSLAQSAPAGLVAAGVGDYLQPSELTVQIDIHGPNSADNAQTITTLFRDDYAVQQFKTSGIDVSPLHADDPRQVPFINDQTQYENRWIVEAHLQVNAVVVIPQQFAGALGPVTLDPVL